MHKTRPRPAAARRSASASSAAAAFRAAYLPHLTKCPYVEVVSPCDINPERAEHRPRNSTSPNHYPHIEEMLAGAEFDLLVNTTDMQEHEQLNREAIDAGKHVWSEKPIANIAGRRARRCSQLAKTKGVRVWGAPIAVHSPQFAFMAKTLAAGKLGRVAAAHADYGHKGPDWSAFFYEKGGGSMPDLGVYNLTSLTGLLGPAKSVAAMVSIVTPTRKIDGKGEIKVTEEDNAMVLLDHGNGVISHVQCGSTTSIPHGHDGSKEPAHDLDRRLAGYMGLVGYDWEPLGVDLATEEAPELKRHCRPTPRATSGSKARRWSANAWPPARNRSSRRSTRCTCVEIMTAARQSQAKGRRIELTSTFKWPVVG